DADAVDRIVDAKGLRQISDSGELERLVDEVIADHAKSVEEFRAGPEKACNALVGQVMKATRGKANPQQVNELLRRRLGWGRRASAETVLRSRARKSFPGRYAGSVLQRSDPQAPSREDGHVRSQGHRDQGVERQE